MSDGAKQVLEEYLVSIGYQTDAISLRKFEDGMSKTGKKIFNVGAKVAGVVVAVEAAAAAFAYSMRKMYFESELSQSSVKNLNALKFAGSQIGVTGDAMANAVHGMAQAMRLNPGLQGLVESFGVRVSGRDMSDVMLDFVSALKSMPEFAGAQYAALFGIDPDTFHQMINNMGTLRREKKKVLDLYKQEGVDPDAAKKTVLEYTAALDTLRQKLDILTTSLMTKFLPAFKQMNQEISDSISYWIQWARGNESLSKTFEGASASDYMGFMKWVFTGEEPGAQNTQTPVTTKKPNVPMIPPAGQPAAQEQPFSFSEGMKRLWEGTVIKGLMPPSTALQGPANTRIGGTPPTPVNVQQQTTINVHGADAASTGKAVAKEQTRVNGDLVRNMKGALQ